jgi:type IV secretion system protein VirD4
MVKRLAILTGALLLGAYLGLHVFAWRTRYHPTLGTPLGRVGLYRLYSPWQAAQWVTRWGWGYPGTFREAGVVMGLTAALVLLPLARRAPPLAINARWATLRDLRKAKLCGEKGAVLGKVGNTTLRHDGPEHMLVVAPTRSGKSLSLVVPTLLTWPESVIIYDPKEELHHLTAGWRKTFSRVVHVHPVSPVSEQWNPFEAIRLSSAYEIADTLLVAEVLLDPDGELERGGAAEHFHDLARMFHTGLILYGLHTGQACNLAELDALLTSDIGIEDLLVQMEAMDSQGTGRPHPAVRRALVAAKELQDKELSGLLSTARRATELWLDPLVARTTSRSDFHLSDLREATRPISLYLTVPFKEQPRLRPLTRLLLWQWLGACIDSTRLLQYRHRLLGVIDEVASLKYFPLLPDGLDYFAGFGVRLMLITPSLNSLIRPYGRYNNFLEGCRYKVVFRPEDPAIANVFSPMTLTHEVKKVRKTRLRGYTSSSTEKVREPLLSPTALMQLPDDTALLLGAKHPALVKKAWYFDNPEWRERSALPA